MGAVVAAATLAMAAAPAAASAQDSGESGSLGDSVGVISEEIVVGGPALGGSEGLRDAGSGAVPEAAQSAGEVAGSTAPLEAVGSTGGSAAASVASSGSVPGSVYANPTGSVGSGTIGLGSVAVPEYVLPMLSVQFAGGYFTAMGERQQAAELHPHELTFWHDVVGGSAEAGTALEDTADAAGAELPGGLAGSIDAVQISALEDPFEEQEKLKAELEAEAAAEAAAEEAGTDG